MPLENTFRLAISDEFLDGFSRLPRDIQSKASKFINQFKQNPTAASINYESIQNSTHKDLKSVRIDQAYRAILLKPDVGNIYVLLWVDHHDQAYAWAQRKTCVVNQVSGALQIIDVENVKASTTQLQEKHQNQALGRFSQIKDKHLMRLGVPEILLPAVKMVITDEDVDQILPHLPVEASDALVMLAAGYSLEQVFNELDKRNEPPLIDAQDLSKALENRDSLARFVVITDDSELEEMLAAPLEKWRVFLHPTQRKLVERNWSGAVRVLGGAGTGKTVVAIHRAKWLALHCFKNANERILLTTFTRNLAIDIEANLKTICPPELANRIRVINLDALVSEFLKQEGINTKIAYSNLTRKYWDDAYTIAPAELGLPLSFYQEEWEKVFLSQGCRTLREYLVVSRIGRGTKLSRQQRQLIWPVFEEYQNLLRKHNLREPDEAFRDVAEILNQKGEAGLPYQSIIVDEAQDMSPAAFILLRALAGQPKQNDLFIVGDSHQRIYGKTVSLKKCGIDIVGRSHKLRLNYRTTDETRRWATAILTGVTVDDLDDGVDTLNDYKSLMYGEEPLIQPCLDMNNELEFIVRTLDQIQANDHANTTACLVFRTNARLEQYEAELRKLNIPLKRIHRNQADNLSEPGVRIATMHRVKGLQFNYIFLPGLNHDVLPDTTGLLYASDEVSRQEFIRGERCLLHVAATRARNRVFVSFFSQPSSLLSHTEPS